MSMVAENRWGSFLSIPMHRCCAMERCEATYTMWLAARLEKLAKTGVDCSASAGRLRAWGTCVQ